MRAAAIYAVAVGLLMICQWVFFLASGQVPEVLSAPVELAFHLAAELATALALIVGGLATLSRRSWGRSVAVLSFGMVSYSIVVSAGYFAQQGGWALVAMFAALLAGSAASVLALIRPTAAEPRRAPSAG